MSLKNNRIVVGLLDTTKIICTEIKHNGQVAVIEVDNYVYTIPYHAIAFIMEENDPIQQATKANS